jgi:hypothetical protein
VKGTLYINPEWDMLYIRTAESPITLVDFLYRLKSFHDPSRIGLLNLALPTKPLGEHGLTPAELLSEPGAAFLATVTQLREVFFVHSVYNRRYMDTSSVPDPANIHVNRSLPLMADTPYFERISRDPRSIGQDLRSLHVQNMSLIIEPLRDWIDQLELVPQPPPAGDHRTPEFRLVLHFNPQEVAANREAAQRYLEQEERSRTVDQVVGIRPDGETYDLNMVGDLQPIVRRAFGFWIFPLTVLGFKEEARLPSKDEVVPLFGAHMHVDWSMYSPALALADLY